MERVDKVRGCVVWKMCVIVGVGDVYDWDKVGWKVG